VFPRSGGLGPIFAVVKLLDALRDPDQAAFVAPALVVGLAVSVLCSLLSVFVVLRRLSFIGQGISHAALGGVGVAAALGLLGISGGASLTVMQMGVVFGFCLASAVLIGWMSRRGGVQADTAIGIVLVVAMSLGAVLIRARSGARAVSWESFLFGSLLGVTNLDAAASLGVTLISCAALWLARRPLLHWAFDPLSASSLGVSGQGMSLLLMTLLSLATVTTMKLAGVVLTTAMLVLPGAAALKLSSRWRSVLVLAVVIGLAGVLAGLTLSYEFDLAPGASIVLTLAGLFALAWGAETIKGAGRGAAGSTMGA
jgi:ABC-type Mn2+/Zn2+ transport system permease subunit